MGGVASRVAVRLARRGDARAQLKRISRRRKDRSAGAESERAWELIRNGDAVALQALFISRPDFVQALLNKRPDVTSTNPYGRTPLDAAADNGHTDVVDVLLKAGANADLADEYGRTPLQVAAGEGHTDIVVALLKGGVDFHSRNVLGQTALHHATTTAIVAWLLEAGADVNALDQNGWRPLHHACFNLVHDVVSALVNRGALHTEDEAGYLPLHLTLLRTWQLGCSDKALKTIQVLVTSSHSYDTQASTDSTSEPDRA